ncbi:LacI family transcriptional regulator, partial [Rhizobium leguminosarum]
LVADALGNAGIIGVYSLGAGNRGLIRALKEKAVDRVLTLIAHELTAHTRAALIDNTIDALLRFDDGKPVRLGFQHADRAAHLMAGILVEDRID